MNDDVPVLPDINWVNLEDALNGGLRRGEVLMVAGTTKKPKSKILNQIKFLVDNGVEPNRATNIVLNKIKEKQSGRQNHIRNRD